MATREQKIEELAGFLELTEDNYGYGENDGDELEGVDS